MMSKKQERKLINKTKTTLSRKEFNKLKIRVGYKPSDQSKIGYIGDVNGPGCDPDTY